MRENVELVTDPIEEVKRDGIETRDGTFHAIDALVLATGFSLGLATAPFPIFGRGGRSLDDAWRDGAVAYKGMAVSGFPNWFIMMGPNTGPGHTSVLVFTEAQIHYSLQAIQQMLERDWKWVDVRQDVQDEYNAGIQGRMKHMSWQSGCNSWYLSADGSNHSLYPGPAAEYALRARRFVPSEYEIAHT
jgi:cation diffusion facilitator CzcD-associated flavoprotein CzcO